MSTSAHVLQSVDEPQILAINRAIQQDAEMLAAAAGLDLCFALSCADSDASLVFVVEQGLTKTHRLSAATPEPHFRLQATADHWDHVFAAKPQRPFQSYWGMLRILGRDAGVEVLGDQTAFSRHARIWRIALDRTRDGLHPPPTNDSRGDHFTPDDERDDDSIIGHYLWLTLPDVGKSKIFYEVAGQGAQHILFLHTAGADARQYHSLMMDRDLQKNCTMYAFDLPGHGRSFPGQHQYPGAYANSEEFYVAAINQVISRLKLQKVIVSGASMGGQVCLAVALRAKELDVGGVIACEACDYIPQDRAQKIYSLVGDEAILNPERVCGMISPSSSAIYKRLNWWIYSSQATKIFPGDLKFYFEGWDGRGRMSQIDTQICPVYMLTGEYDYSCSPDMSRATAAKIKGAVFEEMHGLGHFPASEDPERFLPYFNKALEHVQRNMVTT